MNTDNVVAIQQDTREEIAPTFGDFWLLVVKKSRKYETRLEWGRLNPGEQVDAIIGAAKWRQSWLRSEWQFIVDPCRWVKYRRWEDELPDDSIPAHASHIIAPVGADPAPAVRTAIPEHVRALMAKLRARS